jgi:hypothetical protein
MLKVIKEEEEDASLDTTFSEFQDLFSFPDTLTAPAASPPPTVDVLSRLVEGYVDSQPGTAQGSLQGQTGRQAGDRSKFLDVKMTSPGAAAESVILLASEGSQVHRTCYVCVAKRDADHDILSYL